MPVLISAIILVFILEYTKKMNTQQFILDNINYLNAFKENLYTSFLNSLNDNIQVDIFFHHFSYDMFSKLISDNIGSYNYYIIQTLS